MVTSTQIVKHASKISPKTIELNDDFKKALHLLEDTTQHLFITGKAGTGKSTLLEYFRSNTKKKIVVLAPTGVAALNVKGQTIHSFFKFKPNVNVEAIKKQTARKNKSLYKKLDAIVIDEISMVRADILDCIDRFMRIHGQNKNEPFGGVQMIFIGDLYQLPPVVTSQEKLAFKLLYPSPYFFDANVFSRITIELVELEKIYRQKDATFIKLLNAIRNNSAQTEHIEMLNKHCLKTSFLERKDEFTICLTTTNARADTINQEKLGSLKTKTVAFEAKIMGEFKERDLPTAEHLVLKIGAQVMFLNNDLRARWVNGSIGKIVDFENDADGEKIILVEKPDGEVVDVSPYSWELFDYVFDQERQRIDSSTVGSFRQYPLRLAWAITIHKSQGKTFERVVLDLERGTFAHGQLYVALSRCTNLDGLILKQPVKKSHILMDWHIVRFLTQFQYKRSDTAMPLSEKMRYIETAIASEQKLHITYLKSNDEKSKRVIGPREIGEMEYLGKKFLGLEAYCFSRQEVRIFRIDRILEMRIADE